MLSGFPMTTGVPLLQFHTDINQQDSLLVIVQAWKVGKVPQTGEIKERPSSHRWL